MPTSVFDDLTPDQLTAVSIYVHLICGRSKIPVKGQGRALLCGLGKRFDLLLGERGLPALTPPYHEPAKNPDLVKGL